jgi:hypothetical protein
VVIGELRGRRVLFRPGAAAGGAAAHAAAEALLGAPRVLGSLDLLGNPAGLAASLGAGLRDLLGRPLAALQAGSPAQVLYLSQDGLHNTLKLYFGLSEFRRRCACTLKQCLYASSVARLATVCLFGIFSKAVYW